MSEDVVEFGGSTPVRRREPNPNPNPFAFRAPQIPWPLSVLAAGAAAVAGIASLLGRWQVAVYEIGEDDEGSRIAPPDREIAYDATTSIFGWVYILTLLVIVLAVVIAFQGLPAARHTARLAAFASGGFAIAIVALSAYSFSSNPYRVGGYLGSAAEIGKFSTKMEWGMLAAFAAGALAILAVWLQPSPTEPAADEEPALLAVSEPIEYDDVDELTVTVEQPTTVSPSHELYMRK